MKSLLAVRTVAVSVATLLLSTASRGQGTFQITFDGPPPIARGSDIGVSAYAEQQMLFWATGSSGQFGRTGGGISFFPENGTAYIHAAIGDSVAFDYQGGPSFSLVSADLAGYSTVVPDATIDFIGYHRDGTTITTEVTRHGVNFQSYYFGPGWSDLTRVEIPSYGWSLDNLVLSVPEPNPGTLAVLAGTMLWLWRKRMRRAGRI